MKTVYHIKVCEVCGKEYHPAKSYQKRCSQECTRKHGKERQRKKTERDIIDGTCGRSLKIRFMVLHRDSFTCQYCGRTPKDGTKLEVDHIVPKSKGGDNKMDNLITACFECNQGKKDVLLEQRAQDNVIKIA